MFDAGKQTEKTNIKKGERTGRFPVKNSSRYRNIAFFTSAIDTLKTLVIAIGAGLGVWGVVNLLEGYGNDNPGAKSQGIKQLMAGAGIMLLGTSLIPQLATLFG